MSPEKQMLFPKFQLPENQYFIYLSATFFQLESKKNKKVYEADLICLTSENEFFVRRKWCLLSKTVLLLDCFSLYLYKNSILAGSH